MQTFAFLALDIQKQLLLLMTPAESLELVCLKGKEAIFRSFQDCGENVQRHGSLQ